MVKAVYEIPHVLTELNLCRTNLNDQSATSILNALISKDTVRRLNFSNNNLSEKTSYSLSTYLKKSLNLKVTLLFPKTLRNSTSTRTTSTPSPASSSWKACTKTRKSLHSMSPSISSGW